MLSGSLQVGRIVAGVFLELAFNAEIRDQLASETGAGGFQILHYLVRLTYKNPLVFV